MTIYSEILVGGVPLLDSDKVLIKKNRGDNNSTSNFTINITNFAGRNKSTFSLNDEVLVYSSDTEDLTDSNLIFSGIVEDIDYVGKGLNETMTITGRDYGFILQETIARPRIFKNETITRLVQEILRLNIPMGSIGSEGVETISTVLETFTLRGTEYVFDVLKELAERSNCFFYVTPEKQLVFKENSSDFSGVTFNNTNVFSGSSRVTTHSVKNYVSVTGGKTLTGTSDSFVADGIGSVYVLSSKPHNTRVFLSGASDTLIQPGGVAEFSDPGRDDVKFLVNYNDRRVILTSGAASGNNLLPNGSVLKVDYDKATTMFAVRDDPTSIEAYGKREESLIDVDLGDMQEVIDVANAFLTKHKNAVVYPKNYRIKAWIDLDLEKTYKVDLPFHNINDKEFILLSITYDFSKLTKLKGEVISITLGEV